MPPKERAPTELPRNKVSLLAGTDNRRPEFSARLLRLGPLSSRRLPVRLCGGSEEEVATPF